MSPRSPALNTTFDALEIGRLTWLGLALAAIGWALLLGEATVADLLVAKAPRPFGPTFHADLLDIAKCVIASGFGIAIVGALQTGFGTLNRFFGAVLTRSSRRDTEGPRTVEPIVEAPMAPHMSAPMSAPMSPPEPIEERNYRKFPDGSVEVDTIVGTRRFKSMAEAREFI